MLDLYQSRPEITLEPVFHPDPIWLATRPPLFCACLIRHIAFANLGVVVLSSFLLVENGPPDWACDFKVFWNSTIRGQNPGPLRPRFLDYLDGAMRIAPSRG